MFLEIARTAQLLTALCRRTLPLFVFGALCASHSASGATGRLLVQQRPGGEIELLFSGTPGYGIRIEATENLSPSGWSKIASGVVDENGTFSFTDFQSVGMIRRIYRAVLDLKVPAATTTSIAATEDTALTFSVAGTDPLASGSLQAVITRLPGKGALFQADGTPILSVPSIVTDSDNQLQFKAAPDENGAAYTSFSYMVRRQIDEVESAEQNVAVSVAAVPDAPVPTTEPPVFVEDQTPMLIRLQATDVDLAHEGDALRFIIVEPTSRAEIFQVQEDHQTPGARIRANDLVTNSQGWIQVVFVPNSTDTPPNPADILVYQVIDSYQQQSLTANLPISIPPVPDAPVAVSGSSKGFNDDPHTVLTLQFFDVDTGSSLLSTYITQLPSIGKLYVNTVSPGNEVQLGTAYHTNTFVFEAPVIEVRGSTQLTDFGANFASFSFNVVDEAGLSSVTATQRIDIEYRNTPPTVPATHTIVGIEDTPVAFVPQATDVDGDQLLFTVTSLPANGKLLYFGFELTSVPVQIEVPDQLTYQPDPNFNTLGKPLESIGVQISDERSSVDQTILIQVLDRNDAPSITGTSNTTPARYSTEGSLVEAARVTGLTAADPDADNGAPMRVVIRSVQNPESTNSAGGTLQLTSTTGLSDIQHPTPDALSFEATLEQLNATLAAGSIQFAPPGVNATVYLLVEVNDLGASQSDGQGAPETGVAVLSVPIVQN